MIGAGAAQAGTDPDFTPHGTQPFLAFPLLTSEDECRGCHGQNTDAPGSQDDRFSHFVPSNTWGGSMMSHATRNPVFWAALDVANRDVPGSGDYCLRCHAPTAWFGERVRKTGSATVVDGTDGCLLLGQHDDPDTVDSDFEGVGCHVCHRQVPAGPLGRQLRPQNADLWLDDAGTCDGSPCRYGPYAYDSGGAPPHPAAFSEYVRDARFCGGCHDVTTPLTDAGPLKTLKPQPAGVVDPIPFPIERTYSEWKASSYADRVFADGFAENEPSLSEAARVAQTCQSCHMPREDDPQAHACIFDAAAAGSTGTGRRAGNLRTHAFAGANTWVLGLVKTLYGTALGRNVELDRGIAAARAMLQSSATVETTLTGATTTPGGTVTARVRVTNRAGHKLPSGYSEGRRLWLEVHAEYGPVASPTVFWRSGVYDAATGVLADGNAPVKVYEVKHGVWNPRLSRCETQDAMGRELFHFILNDCTAKDNRIPPAGFRGGSDPEIAPVGYVYAQTAPGSGVLVNFDVTEYAIPVPLAATGEVRVSARLRHQVASKDYAEFLRDQAVERSIPSENDLCAADRAPLTSGPRTQSRGAFFYDLWQNNGRSPPELIGSAGATAALP